MAIKRKKKRRKISYRTRLYENKTGILKSLRIFYCLCLICEEIQDLEDKRTKKKKTKKESDDKRNKV